GVVLFLAFSLCPEVPTGAMGFAPQQRQHKRAGHRAPARVTGAAGGLQFQLRDGGPSSAVTPQAGSLAAPLDPDESSRLLARLPAVETDPSRDEEFNFSEHSPPPPVTQRQILGAFSPAAQPPAEHAPAQPVSPAAAALEIVRYAPEGEITIAPHLSV